ncbi:rhodanese-like domain-containing protein [Paenibacillus rhizophilus]|uniref:Rhodanese-like domain-containing protein n=1 Tax=Paenibacillus rhizophilus TaxID=1850366 RepID=A0A3N9P401_9BACL|nr:rhodanese-like domain-containing protein [Paenibacillus rhizophilus]RQW10931.1 rhodanese-like domain-containing protein [Paenibacillus rhizophilus]
MKIQPKSQVLSVPPASPAEAAAYFAAKGRFETDVADVAYDLREGLLNFVLVDVRDARSYEEAHLPGAVSLPSGYLGRSGAPELPRDRALVVYCWGPACNGATKAAARLAAQGYQVKEMLGGIEYWRREGGPLEGTLREEAPLYWQMPPMPPQDGE